MRVAPPSWISNILFPGVLCAAFVLFHFYLRSRAEFVVAEAIRNWGHNVDSGENELFVDWFYALPAAALFAIAAVLNVQGPIWARRGRVFAWSFVVGAPVLLVVFLAAASLFW